MANFPYDSDTEEYMILFFENLSEKDQRYYAAVEAKRLGHGGIKYISDLFSLSEKTIRRGLEELLKKTVEGSGTTEGRGA